jgi:capsular exopolysaccharide synthesis family protein
MSQIFEALQRSEEEQSEIDSSLCHDAAALLQRAESRVALQWTSEKLSNQKCGGESSSNDGSFQTEESPSDNRRSRHALTGDKQVCAEVQLSDLPVFDSLRLVPDNQKRLVCFDADETPASEGFRLLGVRLGHLRRKKHFQKVLITSTIPQEGKSTVAANLACTLALGTQQRVLLLEGDLRRSTVSQLFGIGKNPGLIECLVRQYSLQKCIYQVEKYKLWVMPAGSEKSNTLEILQSTKLPAIMTQLSTWFEWIIIDSPPVLPLADTSIWMRMADGVLLVTRRGITEKKLLTSGVEAIEPNKLLGAILNCSSNPAHKDYYYQSHARQNG